MGLTSLLNVSKQGLFVSQGNLQTISHNISNVNTPGYSRQVVQLESNPGAQIAPLVMVYGFQKLPASMTN